MQAPSVPEVTLSQKLTLLWQTQKPLFIGIVVLISLIFFAIIFVIIYFTVIKPNQQKGQAEKVASHATAIAFHGYQGLRNIANI